MTINRGQFIGEVAKLLFVTLFYLVSMCIFYKNFMEEREGENVTDSADNTEMYPVLKNRLRFIASGLISLVYLGYSAARSFFHAFDCPPVNLSFILYSGCYMVTNFSLALSIIHPAEAVMISGFIMYHVLVLEQCLARTYVRVPRESMWQTRGDYGF
ncbi:hypothetical protein KIPB_000796 [Kipferlia bialata]|uniref:Uncharacterized protein n=1 Tax=Kipferlia bialata TaxID=797122 RepID=A0A9K3CPR0_9EUKA|nr:hypothetical protein KIPB_000796 [Kipferlia bialata]|eukprot:g796.t1